MGYQGVVGLGMGHQVSTTWGKSQENVENWFEGQEYHREGQKMGQSQTQEEALKIEDQNILQQKKVTAAVQSPSIENENTQSHKYSVIDEGNNLGNKRGRNSRNRAQKSIKIKKNKFLKEDEYQPFQKKRRHQTTIRQNQNRNIIPNEVNQIFSYIQKSSKSQFVVNRIFKKYPPSSNQHFTIKKFYLYQSLLKEKISNYINETSLSLVTELYEPRCEVYSEQQQRYYNKVCRMLIQHFLQEDSIFNILTSRRMHKDKKRNHLEMRRVLKQKVMEILRH